MFVRVVAGYAPCRVAPLAHGATLQRSAAPPFPTGSCDPSGAPKQNTLGALPQDPCRWLCWIQIDLRREPKINLYCAQNCSQGSRSASALTALRYPKKSSHYSFARFFRPLRILRLAASATGGARLRIPPPPFPRRERGPDGRATINREQYSRDVRACKNRKPPTLMYLFCRPIVPLL